MMLSIITKLGPKNGISLVRHCSAKTSLVQCELNEKTGYSLVTLNRPPVNSLNLELLTDFSKTLDDLQNAKCRGMILTSASSTVFSAGLDIMEMYKPKEERLRQFWSALQDVWLKLFGSSYPTAAAINGHSPAGGCLLAMSCEYRVMLPNFTIGLNETKLGIVAPTWFMATMKNTIPAREAEIALTTGKLFTTEEALKVGLVDELAADKAEAISKCENFLSSFNKVSPIARGLTKQSLRNKAIQELEENRSQDIDLFVYFATLPKTQKSLEIYLEGLKKKGK